MKDYGKELILDLHECNVDQFTMKKYINLFLGKLIDITFMQIKYQFFSIIFHIIYPS
jgi:hypothetical protein